MIDVGSSLIEAFWAGLVEERVVGFFIVDVGVDFGGEVTGTGSFFFGIGFVDGSDLIFIVGRGLESGGTKKDFILIHKKTVLFEPSTVELLLVEMIEFVSLLWEIFVGLSSIVGDDLVVKVNWLFLILIVFVRDLLDMSVLLIESVFGFFFELIIACSVLTFFGFTDEFICTGEDARFCVDGRE